MTKTKLSPRAWLVPRKKVSTLVQSHSWRFTSRLQTTISSLAFNIIALCVANTIYTYERHELLENYLIQSQQLFNVTTSSKALAFVRASFFLCPFMKPCDPKLSWTMDAAAPAMGPAIWAISNVNSLVETRVVLSFRGWGRHSMEVPHIFL